MLYLYKINRLYRSSGILIPLILLTYFLPIPNLFRAYSRSFSSKFIFYFLFFQILRKMAVREGIVLEIC